MNFFKVDCIGHNEIFNGLFLKNAWLKGENMQKMQVGYQAGTAHEEQEYHQYLFYHPLKQDSQASIKTLIEPLLRCHEFFGKSNC
jgi:hypothetical protein